MCQILISWRNIRLERLSGLTSQLWICSWCLQGRPAPTVERWSCDMTLKRVWPWPSLGHMTRGIRGCRGSEVRECGVPLSSCTSSISMAAFRWDPANCATTCRTAAGSKSLCLGWKQSEWSLCGPSVIKRTLSITISNKWWAPVSVYGGFGLRSSQ